MDTTVVEVISVFGAGKSDISSPPKKNPQRTYTACIALHSGYGWKTRSTRRKLSACAPDLRRRRSTPWKPRGPKRYLWVWVCVCVCPPTHTPRPNRTLVILRRSKWQWHNSKSGPHQAGPGAVDDGGSSVEAPPVPMVRGLGVGWVWVGCGLGMLLPGWFDIGLSTTPPLPPFVTHPCYLLFSASLRHSLFNVVTPPVPQPLAPKLFLPCYLPLVWTAPPAGPSLAEVEPTNEVEAIAKEILMLKNELRGKERASPFHGPSRKSAAAAGGGGDGDGEYSYYSSDESRFFGSLVPPCVAVSG